MKKEQSTFIQFLERISAPIFSFIFVVTTIAQFRKYYETLGFRLTSLSIFILSVVWAVYVWTEKTQH